MFSSSLPLIWFVEGYVVFQKRVMRTKFAIYIVFLFMLFLFIHIDWCPKRFPYQMISSRFTTRRLMSRIEQELLTLPELLSSALCFTAVGVVRSLVLCNALSIIGCPFNICILCSTSGI